MADGPMVATIDQIATEYGLDVNDASIRLAMYAAYRAGQWDEMMGLTVPHERMKEQADG